MTLTEGQKTGSYGVTMTNTLQMLSPKWTKTRCFSRSLLFRKEAHIAHGLDAGEKKILMAPCSRWTIKITTFFANSRMPLFYNGLVDDYYLHKNYFVEVIMKQRRQKIASVNRRDPVHSRWGRMPENKDHVTDFYFSYNFPNPQKTIAHWGAQ